MKKLLLLLLPIIVLFNANAQNVGIGTTSPNTSALLDLSSTSKGLLLPRVNNSQMFGIQTPANGLTVFNTTYNQLYHYDGSNWRGILNNTYWSRPIANRDIMSNASDSVGIGLFIPTRLFDVNGTARIRGILSVDASVNTDGLIVNNTFLANTGIVNGSLQTNDQFVINNASGIIQFKNGAANVGFMQLAGSNLRLGTNAENDDGKLVLRTNGLDRMSIDRSGIINFTHKITSDATGASAPLTPTCWAHTATSQGGVGRGTSNVTVTRTEKGRYRIDCAGITEESCAVFSPAATGITIGHACYDGYILVYIRKSDTLEDFDQGFNFIVY